METWRVKSQAGAANSDVPVQILGLDPVKRLMQAVLRMYITSTSKQPTSVPSGREAIMSPGSNPEPTQGEISIDNWKGQKRPQPENDSSLSPSCPRK